MWQKRKAYKCKDKEQCKYIIVVNEKPIDSRRLEAGVKKGKLVVRRA